MMPNPPDPHAATPLDRDVLRAKAEAAEHGDAATVRTFVYMVQPLTVLALLDSLEAAEADVVRLREARNNLADTLNDLLADMQDLGTDAGDMCSRIETAIAEAALKPPHAD